MGLRLTSWSGVTNLERSSTCSNSCSLRRRIMFYFAFCRQEPKIECFLIILKKIILFQCIKTKGCILPAKLNVWCLGQTVFKYFSNFFLHFQFSIIATVTVRIFLFCCWKIVNILLDSGDQSPVLRCLQVNIVELWCCQGGGHSLNTPEQTPTHSVNQCRHSPLTSTLWNIVIRAVCELNHPTVLIWRN